MFAFGYSYGLCVMALVACGLEENRTFWRVRPQEWQKAMAVPKGLAYDQRKRACKELAQTLFPNAQVTLKTADALLIAEYARRQYIS